VTWPQNLASARGSAQSNVMLKIMELTAFLHSGAALPSGLSERREARAAGAGRP
jgi:hypothetical protein